MLVASIPPSISNILPSPILQQVRPGKRGQGNVIHLAKLLHRSAVAHLAQRGFIQQALQGIGQNGAGAMPFTLTSGARSEAMSRVMWIRADFTVPYTLKFGCTMRPAAEQMFMTHPLLSCKWSRL